MWRAGYNMEYRSPRIQGGGGVYTDTAEKCGRAVYNMEYRSPRIQGGGGGVYSREVWRAKYNKALTY